MKTSAIIWKNSLNYGLITGFVLIIYSLLLYITDMMFVKPFLLNNLVSFILMIVFMMVGTKHLRDKMLDGSISYSKAFLSAFLIGIIAIVLSLIFSNILTYVIDPGIKEKALQYQADKWLSKGKYTEDQINTIMEKQREMSGKGWIIVITQFFALLFSALIIVVIGLVTAAIQKKEGSAFAEAMADVKQDDNQQ